MSSSTPADLVTRVAELMASGDHEAMLSLVQDLALERDDLATERDDLVAKVSSKDAQLAWMRRMLFGRRSERLTREALNQLVLDYGGTVEQGAEAMLPVPGVTQAEPEEAPRPGGKARPNHRGRTKLSPDLERVVTEIPVADAERECPHCHAELEVFDHEDHERVEYVPAKLVVHVTRRPKLGCRKCKCHAVTVPRPEEPESPPLRVGGSLLAHLMESKCDDALPIHRQCDQLARLGFELPPSTAYGYWKYATDLLLPVCEAHLGLVLDDPVYVAADDTGIDVLDPTRKGGKFRGHFWCFRNSRGELAYHFTETWEAAEIAPYFQLIHKDAHIQVDDYKGYSSTIEGPDGELLPVVPRDRRIGCMMHVRRRFHDALKAGDSRAGKAVAWIAELYKVEERARGRPPDERLALRTELSLPVLDAFDGWVDDLLPRLGNTGKLAEAVRYAHQQRVYVRRPFQDGRLEIDNGAVERAIREPALGRKNFLFTGSVPAARRLAGAYSLVQSCRALGIDTRAYLIDVIGKLEAGWPARRLSELVPGRWRPGLE